jgi:hypothetical protein
MLCKGTAQTSVEFCAGMGRGRARGWLEGPALGWGRGGCTVCESWCTLTGLFACLFASRMSLNEADGIKSSRWGFVIVLVALSVSSRVHFLLSIGGRRMMKDFLELNEALSHPLASLDRFCSIIYPFKPAGYDDMGSLKFRIVRTKTAERRFFALRLSKGFS